jgi:polysaccharide deacetylase 2 family uncharacterized protein YibQ
MPKKKTPVRNPWTKDDIRQLKAHSKTRTPVVEVAKAMKRTEAAVRQKAKTIGIGLGHRAHFDRLSRGQPNAREISQVSFSNLRILNRKPC